MTQPCANLLMTRAAPDAERFVALLPAPLLARLTVLRAPLMRIDPCDAAIALTGIGGVIFTSANGVRVAAALGIGAGLPAWCVGLRTAQAARAAGWLATQVGGDAEALLRDLPARDPATPMLHLRGEPARGQIAARLTAMGLPCAERVIYRQRDLPLDEDIRDAMTRRATVAPVFSPRSAARLAAAHEGTNRLYLGAMSAAVADALAPMRHARLAVAARPDADAMADLVSALTQEACRVETKGAAQ